MTRSTTALRCGLLALAGSLALAGHAAAQPYAGPGAPPPPPPPGYAEPPPPPGPGGIWIPAHYRWDGVRYVWIGGHWGHPHDGRGRFVPGHWSPRGWIPDHWAP